MVKMIASLLMLFLLSMPTAHADTAKVFTVCLDASGKNFEDSNQDLNNQSLGAKVEIVKTIFQQAGINVKLVNDGPWKRCMHDVEHGLIDFALGAYFDEERAKVFDYSDHYNTLSPTIFFLKSRHLMIKSADDLKKYRGCGILGYSYAHYNIQSEQLDLTPDYGAIYRKLNAGRCDYFLDELETFADDNDIYSKEILTNPLIVYASASWASSPSSYLVTRKAGPGAEVLKDFNRALKIVIKNGSAAKIWKKGMGDIPFKP